MGEEEKKIRQLFADIIMPAAEAALKKSSLTVDDRNSIGFAHQAVKFWFEPVMERMLNGSDVSQFRNCDSADSPNMMALRNLIVGVMRISAISLNSKSIEKYYTEKLVPEAKKAFSANARAETEQYKLRKALDEIVPAVASEYVAKHGKWILGSGKTISGLAVKLLVEINLRLDARGLGPVKDGAVRKRLSPFIATTAPL